MTPRSQNALCLNLSDDGQAPRITQFSIGRTWRIALELLYPDKCYSAPPREDSVIATHLQDHIAAVTNLPDPVECCVTSWGMAGTWMTAT
jgi:hypothetical protein